MRSFTRVARRRSLPCCRGRSEAYHPSSHIQTQSPNCGVRSSTLTRRTPHHHAFLSSSRLPVSTSECIARAFSSSPCSSADSPDENGASTASAPLSTDNYHVLADNYLETLLEAIEDDLLITRYGVDVEYHGGVMTLKVPPLGTYVLNKQPPNKQIWLSSPVSGPKRYDWVPASPGQMERAPEDRGALSGQWLYSRDGSSLTALLEKELETELPNVKSAEYLTILKP